MVDAMEEIERLEDKVDANANSTARTINEICKNTKTFSDFLVELKEQVTKLENRLTDCISNLNDRIRRLEDKNHLTPSGIDTTEGDKLFGNIKLGLPLATGTSGQLLWGLPSGNSAWVSKEIYDQLVRIQELEQEKHSQAEHINLLQEKNDRQFNSLQEMRDKLSKIREAVGE